nr:hypothetical protein BaRGS_027769 [Batillaria attramentaria]
MNDFLTKNVLDMNILSYRISAFSGPGPRWSAWVHHQKFREGRSEALTQAEVEAIKGNESGVYIMRG